MSILINNKISTTPFIRDNGWTRPLNKFQILTWIIILIFSLLTFGVELPTLPKYSWTPAFICFSIFLCLVVGFLLAVTTVDPSDPLSFEHRKKSGNSVEIFDRSKHKHVIENGYCNICRCAVDKSSKHCQPCNKCVKNFDHHCIWLNNCIGSKNYKIFLILLSVTLIICIGMLAISLYVFILGFVNEDNLNPDVWWKYSNGIFITFQTFIGIKILLLFITVGLVGQLAIFHLFLIFRNQTTYSHYKRQEEKKATKRKAASEAASSFEDMPLPACSSTLNSSHTNQNLQTNHLTSNKNFFSLSTSINSGYHNEVVTDA